MKETERKRLEEFDNHPAITRTIWELLKAYDDMRNLIKAIIAVSITTLIFAIAILTMSIAILKLLPK